MIFDEFLMKIHQSRLRGAPDGRGGHEADPVLVPPSPATHAILAELKVGETVYQPGELPKTLRVTKIHYEPPKTVQKHGRWVAGLGGTSSFGPQDSRPEIVSPHSRGGGS